MDRSAEQKVDAALKHWVHVRMVQQEKSRASGKAQEGDRSAVTGGAHLDGLNTLIVKEIEATGTAGLEIRTNRKATLPGYYRPSKSWDLLVLQQGSPVLAVEYKSMKGSEGKNLNNRADEIFGMAEDPRQAELNGRTRSDGTSPILKWDGSDSRQISTRLSRAVDPRSPRFHKECVPVIRGTGLSLRRRPLLGRG